MARNAEKAMTTLARWRAAHVNEGEVKARRPFLAAECTDLPQAERWRMQIIREIARKVSQIQNAGLGEFRIRDLNDEINKLLREKGHWEAQIKELGGPDHNATGPRMLDHEGKEVPGNRGYKYFGAARLLPGVRELFEQAPPPPPRKTRSELMKNIDADYYGYRDDDDGVLAPTEAIQEAKAIERSIAEWKSKKEASLTRGGDRDEEEEAEEENPEEDIYKVTLNQDRDMRKNTLKKESTESEEQRYAQQLYTRKLNCPDKNVYPLSIPVLGKASDEEEEESGEEEKKRGGFTAHVPVPSQREVEAALLEKKKQELLARYCLDIA